MKRIAPLAALFLVAAAAPSPGPGALAGTGEPARDGEVKAISVLPGTRQVEVVIDLAGAVEVRDFTLRSPDRLVLDLVGARLGIPAAPYDGVTRGGIKNVRTAQFSPTVVRVVIDLVALTDYQVETEAGRVRVRLGAERTAFAAWTSREAPRSAAAPADVPPVAGSLAQAARVSAPAVGRSRSIGEYLAAHAREAAQSQAPRVTVQWDEASIEEVVAAFAAFSGRSIMISKGITGTVTAEVRNQPWDLAFAAVLESQGLAYRVLEGGIINVLPKAELARADSTVPVATELVRINYARASSLVPAVQSIVTPQRGKVVADSSTNALVITDITSRIDDVVAFVRGMDIPTPQVSIQAKIIFVNRTDVEEMGVKYDLGSNTQFFNELVQRPDPASAEPVDTDLDGVPDALVPTDFFAPEDIIVDLGGNALSALGNAGQQVVNPALELIFSTAIGNFDLTSFVQALQVVELSDVQAEPVITTLDNRPASILVGDRVPIRVIDASAAAGAAGGQPIATVRFEQTGINLQVTPHVTANRQVLLEVHAERSSVQPAPVDIGFTFQTQEANNQLLVNDGETAVIAGLTVTEVTVTKSGIPFLVDLPILGRLFGFSSQRENRRDLLILVTPHIIDDLVTPGTGR